MWDALYFDNFCKFNFVDLQFLSNLLCDLVKLFGSEFEVRIGEAHVGLALHGYEVDVSVRDFESQYALSNLDARDGLFDSNGHLLCKDLKSCQFVILKVEEIVYLALGDAQRVPLLERADVEECIILVVLGNLVARYFACYDSAENCHKA